MLETNSNSTLALDGVNQQDFQKFQRVSGTYPYQEGLQARLPGKTLIQIYDGEIGSIFVFYMVFGRTYTFIDFSSIEITEVEVPPITIPPLPPTTARWFDDFGSYSTDLISRLWPAGIWLVGVGVCETIIEGVIDYFKVYDSRILVNTIPTDQQPHVAPPITTPPATPDLPPSGPQEPENCAQLPNQNYQILSPGTYFTAIQRQGGSYDSGEYTPVDLPWPAYHAHPYNDVAGSSLQSQESSIRQTYNNGFVDVSRSRSTGFYTVVDFDFNDVEFPDDIQFWLVGTKSLSDGTGGLTPNLVGSCAALQLSTVGERSGNFVISTSRGTFTTDGLNPGADLGDTTYTELRAYSSTF